MSKFIALRKTDADGKPLEPERWNVSYIKNYRKWVKEGKDLVVVFVDDTETKRGRLIVDNSIEELDLACEIK